MELLAKGKRGIVYLDAYKGKTIAVKMLNPNSQANYTLEKEKLFLQKLNKHHIGPTFYFFKEGKLGMEYIRGERILDYFENTDTKPKQIFNVIQNCFIQAHTMDNLGINKYELTNPYKHIIVQNNKPIMIDFERCRYSPKPKNVTQLLQFFSSEPVLALLQKKRIVLHREKIKTLAEKYAKQQSLEPIVAYFGTSTFATK